MDFECIRALRMRKVRSVLPQVFPHSLLLPGKGWDVYKFLKIYISFSVVETLSGRREKDRRRRRMKRTQ